MSSMLQYNIESVEKSSDRFCCVFDMDYIGLLIVNPSKRRKLNILQNNFSNGNFVIINYDGTVLPGCFAKENRNGVTGKVSNLLHDYYCEFIIIYFILCSNTHKKSHNPH